MILWVYAAAIIGALVISRAITPLFINLAFSTNLLDHPQGRKQHKKPTPFFGGVVIFISFWSVILVGLTVGTLLDGHNVDLQGVPYILQNVMPWGPKIGGVFLGSLLVLLLGIWDDRYNLPPWVKFAGQAVAAIILLSIGLRVNLVQMLGFWGYFVTFMWIVLLMNSFNFIDSIDGHCSGVALISTLMFFCVNQIVGQQAVSLLVVTFGAAILGFFPFNFKPARCFLGDNGSLFIGYMMSVITLLCRFNAQPGTLLSPLIPIVMFGVPIYDTLSVIAVRLFRGIPPWKGDRNHFAHRLVRLGMGEKNAALFSYFVAFTLGLVAVLTTQVTTLLGSILILMLFTSIIGIIAFLEYYVTVRFAMMEKLAEHRRRRRGDIRKIEDQP